MEPFLEYFLQMTVPPLPHETPDGTVDPFDERFSAFVFKIQANMNKAHRDRIAFLRICSGKYERQKEYLHVQAGKVAKLSQPQQMMAKEREIIEEAYAGDIIGVFDPGVFSIGDTVCEPGMNVRYGDIPTFTPEHFAYVEQIDAMKRKQFMKGMNQIAQEGAIRIFLLPDGGYERVVVGVVGQLQYDVLQFRMETEYGVKYRKIELPHTAIFWVKSTVRPIPDLRLADGTLHVKDLRGHDLLVFTSDWAVRWAREKNEGLVLEEYPEMNK